jgi:hypothetical protein
MEQPLEPHLRIGALCERVLEEKDGVLSLIRVIDRLIITAEGTDVPKEIPPSQVPLTALMSWVGGLGDYEAKIRAVFPGGESIESITLPFHLDALDRVQNLIVQLVLPIRRSGVHWFNFLLGDQIKGRVPLRVIYERKEHPKRTGQPT